jgi:hypothetical protein
VEQAIVLDHPTGAKRAILASEASNQALREQL